MKADEIDKIIAEALEKDKQQGRHRGKHTKSDGIETARKILNIVFMVGFLAAVIVYFACPDNRLLFFSLGFGAMIIKIIEFILRFLF